MAAKSKRAPRRISVAQSRRNYLLRKLGLLRPFKAANKLPHRLANGMRSFPKTLRRAPGNIANSLRRSVTEHGEIQARPIGAKKRNLKRIYATAIMGVGLLTVLARINNPEGFYTAFAIALGLAIIFITWMGYRHLLATGLAIGGWLLSTPLVAMAAAVGLEPQYVQVRMATSYEAIIGTGIAVWVCAVLIRARRPWLAIAICWFLYMVSLMIFGQFAPRYSLAGGWLVLALYLMWRAGWFVAFADRLRGRRGLGRSYQTATEEQYEVYEELGRLPRSFRRLYQVAIPAEYKSANTLDALVCGATGLFYVAAFDALGRITVNATGSRRRISVEGVGLDSELFDIARNAQALHTALRVQPTTLVAMCGATFPNATYGILPVEVSLPGETDPVALTLIDPSLLARRIPFGQAVFTAAQVQRIVHRANMTLLEPRSFDFDDRKKKRRVKLLSRKLPFAPGVAVNWVDESGQWPGWICVSGATVLKEVPEHATLTTDVAVNDTVVWIVAEAEWNRARAEGRQPDLELTQPVPVRALTVASISQANHEDTEESLARFEGDIDEGGKR